MKLPKLSTLIGLLGIFFLMLTLCNLIIYNIAKEMCDESEVKPIRWELGGLFGNQKIPIVTTEGNQDSYEKVCTRRGEPDFWDMNDNIEYIINNQRKINISQDTTQAKGV